MFTRVVGGIHKFLDAYLKGDAKAFRYEATSLFFFG